MREKGLAPVSTPTTKNPSRFGFASHLACRECGAISDLGATHVCAECFGPLEVGYDLPALTRAVIEAGPPNIWRYASLLPVPPDVAASPNTEPGCTRLVRADHLARELGMGTLWVKDERANPTHSFKDRVVAVALAAALEMGYKVLACPSTGNLANAVAAAAARDGDPLGGADPRRPGAAEDRRDRHLRRDDGRRGRHLRRREPARVRAGRRARGLGVRERQRAPLLRGRLEDDRVSRSPSSSAGDCPPRSWCRSPPARSSSRSTRRSAS